MTNLFDGLKAPDVEDAENDSSVVFYFTEAGLSRYEREIELISSLVETHDGWELRVCKGGISEEDLTDALYSDEYQVAWSYVYVKDNMFRQNYRVFLSINNLLKRKNRIHEYKV